MPQNGKVGENNSCLTALVIFEDLSLYQPQAGERNSISYVSYAKITIAIKKNKAVLKCIYS